MRITEKMVENTDTTVWMGGGLILSFIASWEQAVIAIFTPAISWVLLYYVKKYIAYREKTKGEKNNVKKLEE